MTINDRDTSLGSGDDDDDVVVPESVTVTCGYSIIAIITGIIFGAILIIIVLLNGSRRYKAGMPLAAYSSAAISAACHRPEEDVDASVLPVQWGSVTPEDAIIGHCCLTSFEVSSPFEGNIYGGRH